MQKDRLTELLKIHIDKIYDFNIKVQHYGSALVSTGASGYRKQVRLIAVRGQTHFLNGNENYAIAA